jgi:hypothetical protein
MSGKIIINIIVAFILTGIGYSCKSTNNVSSEKLLQKRKYRSGYYVNLPKRSHSSIGEYSPSRIELKTPESKSMGAENLQEVDFSTVMDKEAKKEETSNIAESKRKINKEQNIENYSDTKNIIVTSNREGVYFDDPPKQKLELLGLISFILMILGVFLVLTDVAPYGAFVLIAAIILSIISLIKFSKSKVALKGEGWAIATLLGLIGISVITLIVISVGLGS